MDRPDVSHEINSCELLRDPDLSGISTSHVGVVGIRELCLEDMDMNGNVGLKDWFFGDS